MHGHAFLIKRTLIRRTFEIPRTQLLCKRASRTCANRVLIPLSQVVRYTKKKKKLAPKRILYIYIYTLPRIDLRRGSSRFVGKTRRGRERERESYRHACGEINNPSFLMPRYRASSRLYNAAGARTSDGIVVSRTG